MCDLQDDSMQSDFSLIWGDEEDSEPSAVLPDRKGENKMRSIQDIVPEYRTIGEPVIVATKELSSRDELRITQVQKNGENAVKIDIRYHTVHKDGSETAHKGGLRLSREEATALQDALAKVLQE